MLSSSLSLLLPPDSLACSLLSSFVCFPLSGSGSLLASCVCLPLADCNVFSDTLPLAIGGVGGYDTHINMDLSGKMEDPQSSP